MAKKHISFWIEDKDLKECDANVLHQIMQAEVSTLPKLLGSIIHTYITKIMKNILINISEIICQD